MSRKDPIGLSMWAKPRLDLTSADLHNHAQPLEVVVHVEVDCAGDRHGLPMSRWVAKLGQATETDQRATPHRHEGLGEATINCNADGMELPCRVSGEQTGHSGCTHRSPPYRHVPCVRAAARGPAGRKERPQETGNNNRNEKTLQSRTRTT